MISQRLILAALAGVVALVAVEALQASTAVDAIQREGVSINIAGADVHLNPPKGGGDTVKLPPEAQRAIDGMHIKAAVAAVVVAVVVVVVTKP